MKKSIILIFVSFIIMSCSSKPQKDNNDKKDSMEKTDTIQSGKYIPADEYFNGEKNLYVTLLGHASLMFEYDGKIIHVDPYSKVVDYSKLPKADLILITHEHYDHLDSSAIEIIKKPDTKFIMSQVCYDTLKYGTVVNNGDSTSFEEVKIRAVPAYNIVHKRPDGECYHPKGRGNGYVLSFGNLNVYVAGDTENIPEMDALKGICDVAFLPKNLPYTMDDDMFIDAARKVSPKVLYPYHMTDFDMDKIDAALRDIDVLIEVRPMSNIRH